MRDLVDPSRSAQDDIGMTLDTQVLDAIIELRSGLLTQVMFFFTYLGNIFGVTIIGASVVLLVTIARRWRELIFFLVAVLGSSMLMIALKIFFVRERPLALSALDYESSPAFPSGHAMVAIALYGALTIIMWKSRQRRSIQFLSFSVSIFLIFMIGVSRLYLGVHWPSDVLGGYILGGFWLWISYRLAYAKVPDIHSPRLP